MKINVIKRSQKKDCLYRKRGFDIIENINKLK